MARVLMLLAAVALVGGSIIAGSAGRALATKPKDYANTVAAASQLNEQWEKTFDQTGTYPDNPGLHQIAYISLFSIPPESKSYSSSRGLLEKFADRQTKIDAIEKKTKAERIANDADGRERFASSLDADFIKDGREARFSVSGPKNTTLDMVSVSINRLSVYKMTSETGFLERAWDAGFKTVNFRSPDNAGNSWTYDIPNEWASAR